MKRILFSLFLAMISLAVSAQSYWGIRAGWDGTFPGNWKAGDNSIKMYKAGSGLYAGAIYNYPVVGGLYIEPGAGIYYNTYRYYNFTIVNNGFDGKQIEDPGIKKFGFRIPVRLGYFFDIFPNGGGVSIYTGPQFDLGVSAKVDISDEDSKEFEFERNLYSDFHGLRRFNLSWTVGANMYIGDWVIEVTGAFGLTDLNKSAISNRENHLMVGLGYNF